MEIEFEELKTLPIEKHKIEIVERKGLGHPDTICDLLCENISLSLCKEYLKKFGEILHFNIDKALLAAGEAINKFGGGKVISPMKFVFGDRATYEFDDEKIDINKIVIDTSKKWFKENFRFIEDWHVDYQIEIKRGSMALQDIFKRRKEDFLGANDTSACVGYYPYSTLENTVIKVERFLNSKEFKKRFPESGEDIKIMGIRRNSKIKLIIAHAFVDKFINSEDEYFKRKSEIVEEIKNFLDNKNIEVVMNALDERNRGEAGLYLTVTGTCAESADSGQVGRGNKVNGVFSLQRPISSEAAAGKNPVSHIGKIYNYLSFQLAKEIKENFEEIEEVYIWLVSKIGTTIRNPEIVSIQILPRGNFEIDRVKNEIEEIINKRFHNLKSFIKDLIDGKITGFL